MDLQFGFYPEFYVKRKDLLFPLIEKYTGESMKGKTHGDVIHLYYELIRSNDSFKNELDNIIGTHGYKNAGGAGAAIVGGITGMVGSIFGFATAKTEAESKEDEQFMDAVLMEQKRNDTTKLLIISGITIVIIGLGVYFVVKMKRK